MYEGAAYEFLFLIGDDCLAGCAIWRVKPLFVDQPDRDLAVSWYALLKPLHSKAA